MNERIQELMKQSMVEYQFDMRLSPEKFAELIVKECMKLNRDILCEDDPDYLDQVYNEHFGVG
jgi:hypothetical protein